MDRQDEGSSDSAEIYDLDVIYTPYFEVHENKQEKTLRREFLENLKGYLYMCFPIYNYRLGIETQSVSVEGRRKHYKDHLEVDKRLVSFYRSVKIVDKQVKEYVRDCISGICASGITDHAMVVEPDKDVKRELIFHDIYKKVG